jgi:hypothetical protein
LLRTWRTENIPYAKLTWSEISVCTSSVTVVLKCSPKHSKDEVIPLVVSYIFPFVHSYNYWLLRPQLHDIRPTSSERHHSHRSDIKFYNFKGSQQSKLW